MPIKAISSYLIRNRHPAWPAKQKKTNHAALCKHLADEWDRGAEWEQAAQWEVLMTINQLVCVTACGVRVPGGETWRMNSCAQSFFFFFVSYWTNSDKWFVSRLPALCAPTIFSHEADPSPAEPGLDPHITTRYGLWTAKHAFLSSRGCVWVEAGSGETDKEPPVGGRRRATEECLPTASSRCSTPRGM